MLSFKLPLLAAIACLPLTLSNPLPNGPESQPGTGQVAFGQLFAVIFSEEVFGGSAPACDSSMSEKYWWAHGKTDAGNYWLSCWTNDTGLQHLSKHDIDRIDCLTNLHYTQADTCISVEGSMCDHGYIDGGGRVQNLRIPILGSGTQSAAQLSADESDAIQGAAAYMTGQSVDGTDSSFMLFAVTGKDATEATSDAAQMQVLFIGEDEC